MFTVSDSSVLDEEEFARQMYTTQEERDPTKPFLIADGFVIPNPAFGNRMEAYKPENYGTSFFVNFAQHWHAHQIDGDEGNEIRHEIARQYKEVCRLALFEISGLNDHHCEVMLCPRRNGMNNGEMYAWFWKCELNKDQALQVLLKIIELVRERPMKITLSGAESEVQIIGWGIRSYSF
jgi:hypothetical protein